MCGRGAADLIAENWEIAGKLGENCGRIAVKNAEKCGKSTGKMREECGKIADDCGAGTKPPEASRSPTSAQGTPARLHRGTPPVSPRDTTGTPPPPLGCGPLSWG